MAQAETEKLTRILFSGALSRAVCTIAELGIADHIEAGSPQAVESLAGATGAHERSLYRILRFLASHEIFQEKGHRQFDHTPLSQCDSHHANLDKSALSGSLLRNELRLRNGLQPLPVVTCGAYSAVAF